MKLYDGGRNPNPRRVRVFLSEKGLEVPFVFINLAEFEHKSNDMMARNQLGEIPVLELDDGTFITETIAICRYFEALHPTPSLFGQTPLEIATIEMWQRRVELRLFLPIAAAFRHTHPAMAPYEVPQIAEWGEANRPKALAAMEMIDQQLADMPFIAGQAISVADITALIALDFIKPAKITIPVELVHLNRWLDMMRARPSAQA
ncbi:MAG: glutathione S-transferase [Notoacmeibacter sp.]